MIRAPIRYTVRAVDTNYVRRAFIITSCQFYNKMSLAISETWLVPLVVAQHCWTQKYERLLQIITGVEEFFDGCDGCVRPFFRSVFIRIIGRGGTFVLPIKNAVIWTGTLRGVCNEDWLIYAKRKTILSF